VLRFLVPRGGSEAEPRYDAEQMCILGNPRLRLAALAVAAALLPANLALAQDTPQKAARGQFSAEAAPPALAPVAAPPLPQLAPAPAPPLPQLEFTNSPAPVSAGAADTPPFSTLEPSRPAAARAKRWKKKAAAVRRAPEPKPLDPNDSRGTTHQDPLLLLGVVAFALYCRRFRDDEFEGHYHALPPDAPELLRNYPGQLANPRIVLPPPLPDSFRVTNVSWTATVPGSARSAAVAPPSPAVVPAPQAAPAPTSASKPDAPLRVLLVGGEPEWVRFQMDVLAADGAEVELCDANKRAVDRLARAEFDAIIVDAEMTGDNAAPAVRRWLAKNRPGMEKRLIVSVGDLCDARTSALLEEARALTLTRPCGVQDLLVIVRLAVQRGGIPFQCVSGDPAALQ
jgi:CheY-like chemotaxis protein